MDAAITREKQLKRWNRDWKCRLIEEADPDWDDLAIGLGLPPLVNPAKAGTMDGIRNRRD